MSARLSLIALCWQCNAASGSKNLKCCSRTCVKTVEIESIQDPFRTNIVCSKCTLIYAIWLKSIRHERKFEKMRSTTRWTSVHGVILFFFWRKIAATKKRNNRTKRSFNGTLGTIDQKRAWPTISSSRALFQLFIAFYFIQALRISEEELFTLFSTYLELLLCQIYTPLFRSIFTVGVSILGDAWDLKWSSAGPKLNKIPDHLLGTSFNSKLCSTYFNIWQSEVRLYFQCP